MHVTSTLVFTMLPAFQRQMVPAVNVLLDTVEIDAKYVISVLTIHLLNTNE